MSVSDNAVIKIDPERLRNFAPTSYETLVQARKEVEAVIGPIEEEKFQRDYVGGATRVGEILLKILKVLADEYEVQPFTSREVLGVIPAMTAALVQVTMPTKEAIKDKIVTLEMAKNAMTMAENLMIGCAVSTEELQKHTGMLKFLTEILSLTDKLKKQG